MKRTQTLLRLLATAPKPKVVKRSNLYDESDTLKFNRNKILLFTALDYQQKNIITNKLPLVIVCLSRPTGSSPSEEELCARNPAWRWSRTA